MFSTQKTFKFSVDKQQYKCYSTIIAKNVNSKGGVHMRTNLFKKVLVTVLATAVMWTSVAPATVEAANKDTKKPTVQVKVINRSKYALVKNSRNKGTFKKGFHTLKSNTYYSCEDLQICVSDASGIKSIKLEGTVRDLYLYDGDLKQCLTRKVNKKIKVGTSSEKITFKLSENINKGKKTMSDITDGSYKLTVVDNAGNKQTIKFTVDSSNPVRRLKSTVKSKYLKGVKNVIIDTTLNSKPAHVKSYWFDALSGLDWVKINGKKISIKNIRNVTDTVDYTVRTEVVLCDKAGNTNRFLLYGYVDYSK